MHAARSHSHRLPRRHHSNRLLESHSARTSLKSSSRTTSWSNSNSKSSVSSSSSRPQPLKWRWLRAARSSNAIQQRLRLPWPRLIESKMPSTPLASRRRKLRRSRRRRLAAHQSTPSTSHFSMARFRCFARSKPRPCAKTWRSNWTRSKIKSLKCCNARWQLKTAGCNCNLDRSQMAAVLISRG